MICAQVAAAAWDGYLHDAVVRESAGIYSFELFSKAFCETFLREVDNYDASGLPVRRPNSMNNYGLIVNEIGMRDAITELQQDILWPVARLLWPLQSTQFDAHHSFIVRYKSDEDPGLDTVRIKFQAPTPSTRWNLTHWLISTQARYAYRRLGRYFQRLYE